MFLSGVEADQVTCTFLPDNAAGHRGRVGVGSGPLINYTGLRPVAVTGTISNLVLNLPAGDGDNQAILADDASDANNMSQVRSGNGSFETTTFVNPTTSLTINTGGDGETVTVARPDPSLSGPINVNAGQGWTRSSSTSRTA